MCFRGDRRFFRGESDEFRGKKVVVFSLPGAFTPTCSNEQCPSFDRLYDEFREFGVDEVYCIAVNDAFVMYQWGQHLGLRNVKLLPDGSGAFTLPRPLRPPVPCTDSLTP